jgi:hypothetical protein
MRQLLLSLAVLLTLPAFISEAQVKDCPYHVAAYVWPSCHNDPRGQEVLWPEGTGEWEVIKKGTPRFPGHYQPKQPLWGYEMDDDPKVMERWIDAATAHGVNTFIFDWYWFDGGPFLEGCLDDGFLKASNNGNMNFYIMWANHDVKRNYWNVHRCPDDDSILWKGATDEKNFRIIVERVIRKYFKCPNYLKIDGCPVFSIYKLENLLATFGGSREKTKEGLEYFRSEVRKAGFPDLHLQIIHFGPSGENIQKTLEYFGVNSVTTYNWGGPHREDYLDWGNTGMTRLQTWSDSPVPFFPNVSIGWDNTPRFPKVGREDVIHYNNTPESFATYLQAAKEYLDAHPTQPKVITVFAWNEWIESGYLLPDRKYGFGYLEAVRSVLEGKYERFR